MLEALSWVFCVLTALLWYDCYLTRQQLCSREWWIFDSRGVVAEIHLSSKLHCAINAKTFQCCCMEKHLFTAVVCQMGAFILRWNMLISSHLIDGSFCKMKIQNASFIQCSEIDSIIIFFFFFFLLMLDILYRPQDLVWHKKLFMKEYEDAASEWNQ